ncbi:hypothetical protein [Spiroplasma monobiae]|uniref:Chitinase n=1 Tax=Spiroplasma monobiae MQ-1 TaxID=1336748 RepID=A0A2K9LUV9_SPISQ|nr:hypothetical protein [Spiroplasma monobiae]AUM62836.1 hypothetical protein SMONO_v1c05870 [Spiroplasma monobiae MQ-1]
MKKLLTILAAASFVISSTTTTVVSCTVKSKNIDSLNFNWDLGQMEGIINQKTIIQKLAEINDINKDNKTSKRKEIEALASMKFDENSIVKISKIEEDTLENNEKNIESYKATLKASQRSKVLKGQVEIRFEATQEQVKEALNPIQQKERNLMGTWWNWGTEINLKDENGDDKKVGMGYKDPKLSSVVNAKSNPFDIINISALKTNGGEYDIKGLNIGDFTTEPQGSHGDWEFDYPNSTFLTNRREARWGENSSTDKWETNEKIITSLGGATADRMLWRWNQKDELRDKLYEIIDGFGFDGLDLAITGKTLYNRESQETLSQAIKEIMVEYWLDGRDFHLSITSKIPWLFKDALNSNKPTVIPFIESMDGWYNDITILLYNMNRPVNFVNSPEKYTIEGVGDQGKVTIEKGEKIRSTQSFGDTIEHPAYFYGTLRAILDEEWNKNTRFISLANKPIRIGAASTFGSSSGAFGVAPSSTISGQTTNNLEVALNKMLQDCGSVVENIIGFSYFGINHDQIMSNQSDPKNPTNFNYGENIQKTIGDLLTPLMNKTKSK